MLISFVISSQAKEEKLLQTLHSITMQTSLNYEVILINDESVNSPNNFDFFHHEFLNNSKLTLVMNNRSQGPSANWNMGIDLARGTYVCFLKEGDVVIPEFVKTIEATLKEVDQSLDVIQFAQKHVGFIAKENDNSEKLLVSNKVYDLNSDYSPFAYIDQNLYGKLFATDLLKNYRIRFRNSNRFDTLFIYRALGHAKTFYKIPQVLATHLKTPLRYSVFDLVNQWPHILNYYRKIGSYKELHDELNYAYIYQLAYAFLTLSQQLNNRQLYKKALRFSYSKMSGKLGNNFKNNKVYRANKNENFTLWINNYPDRIALDLRHLK